MKVSCDCSLTERLLKMKKNFQPLFFYFNNIKVKKYKSDYLEQQTM